MENSEINDSLLNKSVLSEENVIRCPKCYLIPFISINYSNEQIILNFKCLNNHLINKPLKELYYESKKYQINSIKCKNCEEKDKLYYCIKCYGFYCEKEIHSLEEGHNILIPINKIDCCCLEEEHNKYNVSLFCFTHNKNICDHCEQDEHEGDKIERFKFVKKKEIKNIENNIYRLKDNLIKFNDNINSYISNLQKLIEELKKEFSIFKENNEIKIKLFQDIPNTYKLKDNENSLNYQIIQNIKNIDLNKDEFNSNKILEIKNIIDEQFNNLFEIKNKLLENNINDKKEEIINKEDNKNLKEENKKDLDKKEEKINKDINEDNKKEENKKELDKKEEIINKNINEDNKKEENKEEKIESKNNKI